MTVTRLSFVTRIALACAFLLAACGGATSSAPPSITSPTPPATMTPNLVDLMMGNVPDSTAFVVSGREVIAVTLLNHFVRYRIAVADEPQLATSPDGARLYIVDRDGSQLRLRWFTVLTGELRAQRLESGRLIGTDSARGAVAADSDRLYLLEENNGRNVVQAYDGIDLRPARVPVEAGECADRLLASAARVAVVCRRGQIRIVRAASDAVADIRWRGEIQAATVWSPTGEIAGTAFGGALFRLPGTSLLFETLEPAGWVKTPVGRDGIAYASEFNLVIAQDQPKPRLHAIDTVTARVRSFDLPNRPANGVLAWGQFAYWVADDASGIYHIDLQSGLVEKMHGPLEKGASLGALAVR